MVADTKWVIRRRKSYCMNRNKVY